MDINQGNKKIKELFGEGLSTRDLLVIAAHYRQLELQKALIGRYNNKILDGLFKGCIHIGRAYGSTLCPKILGTYEKEISQDLCELAAGKDCFLDIGCAEGYYTTGIGVATDIPLVLGVDVSEKALALAQKSSEANGISSKSKFFLNLAEAASLVKGRSLVMIDVDGSEIQVIDELFSSLSVAQSLLLELIIETDFREDGSSNAPDIESALLDRGFVVSKVVNQSVSNRFSPVSEALTTSLLDLMVYGIEGRPLNQSWIIAKPSN